ncbi:hypothetical protein UPYG_G00088190, partial [Umbra pygmaea]
AVTLLGISSKAISTDTYEGFVPQPGHTCPPVVAQIHLTVISWKRGSEKNQDRREERGKEIERNRVSKRERWESQNVGLQDLIWKLHTAAMTFTLTILVLDGCHIY